MELTPNNFELVAPGDIISFSYYINPSYINAAVYRSIFHEEVYFLNEEQEDRLRQYFSELSQPFTPYVRFKIRYVYQINSNCINLELDVLETYYDPDRGMYLPGEVIVLFLNRDDEDVFIATECVPVEWYMSNQIYLESGVRPNIIPLTPNVVPMLNDHLQWLYFDPIAIKAVPFDGDITGFDTTCNCYNVRLVNGDVVKIGFVVNADIVQPVMFNNGQFSVFSQSARPRIVRP